MGGRGEGIYSVMGAGAGAWTIFRHLGNFSLSLPSPTVPSPPHTPPSPACLVSLSLITTLAVLFLSLCLILSSAAHWLSAILQTHGLPCWQS